MVWQVVVNKCFMIKTGKNSFDVFVESIIPKTWILTSHQS